MCLKKEKQSIMEQGPRRTEAEWNKSDDFYVKVMKSYVL